MAHVLVTGASGLIGSHVATALTAAGHTVCATYHAHEERLADPRVRAVPLDLDDETSIEAAFRAAWPEVVVHCAALSDLRSCEADPERARRVNVAASVKLARLAQSFGARFLFCSTDQVFDGARGGYTEADPPAPLHVYGRTKQEAEEGIRRVHAGATVLRIALVYGRSPTGARSASEQVVLALRRGERPRLFVDEVRSPVLVDDVARLAAAILDRRDLPLLNVAGPEALSRYDLGVRVARAHGLMAAGIDAVRLEEMDVVPPRPRNLALDVSRLAAVLDPPPHGIDAGLARVAAADAAAGRG